ncbi:biotin-independent malonate decarboxylase subunit beta [Variovorax saccharolyticus]|uniref:biotin-independent malonate decarboxylase subunit beta n=1 Tax=Variovorax saccharolyticus TaxID=3053516 RepID=UPI0025757E73|nr:biotin-independent malonate decarboxylase subunit beta [Variovorax sp. J31P216]MDM0030126.1 biotin-independent malonate decarboxylase subunit beta [Variovorax sp. J31P216]
MNELAKQATSSETDGTTSWYEASARRRVDLLFDAGSFTEFLGPEVREVSPHLKVFDLPEQFDDGIVVGRARLAGSDVYVAAQEGRFMGGAFGEVHGAKLVGLLRAVRDKRTTPLLILFDTGGVRLQEANAGELAIAEIMRAVVEARTAGARVVGLIGGRAGCYGGGGLIAACCSALAISEQGRLAVSGPEVIETNRGVEEFDSRDRALVWRTMGGKHRRLLGGTDAFCGDTVQDFRATALELLRPASTFGISVLRAEQTRLEDRLARFGECSDAVDIWTAMGVPDAVAIPAMSSDQYISLAERLGETCRDAR